MCDMAYKKRHVHKCNAAKVKVKMKIFSIFFTAYYNKHGNMFLKENLHNIPLSVGNLWQFNVRK